MEAERHMCAPSLLIQKPETKTKPKPEAEAESESDQKDQEGYFTSNSKQYTYGMVEKK